jgi:hypothetical protein
MGQFFKELGQTFLPSHWQEICQRPMGKGLGFLSRVLALAFVLVLLLAIPQLAKMPKEMSEQLGKFESLQFSANLNMSSPIKLPREEPVAILDTSGAYTKLTEERLLITKDKIFYKLFFGTHELDTAELKDLKGNRSTVNKFLALVVFFVLPAVLFWAYFAVWLKYFVTVLVLSIILFVLLDLTHWRRTWKELFVIGCYVSTLPLLFEVGLSAMNANLLIPILSIFGLVKLYLVPAVILCVLAIGAALCAHYNKQEQKSDDS